MGSGALLWNRLSVWRGKMFLQRIAVALALFAVSGAIDFAQARHGGSFGGGHHFSGGARSFSFGARPFSGGVRSFSNGGVRSFRPYNNARLFYGPAFFHSRFHHHRFRAAPFVVLGAYPLYGDYGYSYINDCYWLKRQALYTGNPYWWDRYEACRYGYEY
jgi:hypothetical protein